MSEWPKKMSGFYQPDLDTHGVEVVPADLARELYDALDYAMNLFGGDPDALWDKRAQRVLDRYKQEVGE